MQGHTSRGSRALGAMPVGAAGYAPAAAFVVDTRRTCHLRPDARALSRPDATHELFVVRTERGFIVDITALDGVPEMVAPGDAGGCAPVIEVVFGDEAIVAG